MADRSAFGASFPLGELMLQHCFLIFLLPFPDVVLVLSELMLRTSFIAMYKKNLGVLGMPGLRPPAQQSSFQILATSPASATGL